MTWFKVDDAFYRGPKVRRLGNDRLPAVGLWALAGNWAADNIETNIADGFVPWEVVQQWDPKRRYAAKLIDAGLWEIAEYGGEHGVQIHDWVDYQPTAAKVRAERAAATERQRRLRESRGLSRVTDAVMEPVTNGVSNNGGHTVSHTTPSRPVPKGRQGLTLGGDRPVSNHARETTTPLENRPAERCPKHLDHPDPPNCGKCADQRRTAETWDQHHHLAARQAIRSCSLCDGDGWRWINPARRSLGPQSGPEARCDHTREQVTT